MEKEIYVPLTLGLLGKVTRHSCMESGWSDHSFRDRWDRGRSCLHPIRQETEKIEGTRLRRLSQPHRQHVIWRVMFTDPLRKYAKDTDRPRPSKDSTTNPSTGRRGVVSSFPGGCGSPWLEDSDLYNYDVLVKLLSDRFDPASRVLAFRSRFHGRSRRHHDDADTFADALSELCRVDTHRAHQNYDRN